MVFSYIIGTFKYFFSPKVKIPSYITKESCISRKAKIGRFCKINNSKVGRYSYLAKNVELINCEIGKYCSIAKSVEIGLAEHTISFLSTSPLFTEAKNPLGETWTKSDIIKETTQRTTIGNDVWIGERAMIKGGIIIGDGAIIGAGAIVTKDVPPYAIVAGVPAKIIRYRFDDYIIKRCLEIQWWNLDESFLKGKIEYFQKKIKEDDILQDLKNGNL